MHTAVVWHQMASKSLFGGLRGSSGSSQHALSRTVPSPKLVCLLLSLSVAVCQGADFSVTWTPDGVREYNASNPLLVELGDRIVLECPRQGEYAYSNLWIQQHIEQYMNCNCMAILGENCDSMVAKNAQCLPQVPNPILTIRRNDAELNSVVNFNPGQLYYLTSYAPQANLSGAYSDVSMGGQCLEGLRMVIEVMELPTQPATTASDQNTTESAEEPLTNVETLSMSSSDENTGLSTEPYPPVTSSDENTRLTESLNATKDTSQEIRDWHVGVIVLMAAVIVAAVVIFVVIIGVILCRRRTPLTHPEEKKQVEYPNMVFEDPVDTQQTP